MTPRAGKLPGAVALGVAVAACVCLAGCRPPPASTVAVPEYVRVRAWADAPPICLEDPVAGDPRVESVYALSQMLRWIEATVRSGATSPPPARFLDEVSAQAARGDSVFIVVPHGYEPALRGSPHARSLTDAVLTTFDERRFVTVLEVEITGTRNAGPGASPVLGHLDIRLLQPTRPFVGRFGGRALFCVMPGDGGPLPEVFFDLVMDS